MLNDEHTLPQALRERYEWLSDLKGGDDIMVCAARDRLSREKVLLKLALTPAGAGLLNNEYALLRQIHSRDADSEDARSFPALRDSGETPGFWFAREWIEGHTVEALAQSPREMPGMGRAAALDCLISVTERLRFLHALRPPVIHRDIKPQNVLVDVYGQCRLIDLGISRHYQPAADEDTVISGTRATAPPEQFGYRQTDARSDLYSCGVLLRYALTGEYDERADASLDEDLRRIIRRATMFDPAQRYQSADELLQALLNARFHTAKPATPPRRRRRWPVAAVCALLAVLAGVGVLALRQRAATAADRPYTFREPLIEQAVRAALLKPDGALTQADLDQVTALRIYGRQVFQYEEQFWLRGEYDYCYNDAFRESGLYEQNGGITSLDDIQRMPNLSELSLYNQNISDIEPLRGTAITRLGLAHNPLASLAPLRGNPSVISLNISCLPLDGLGDVATLSGLRELNISDLHVNSVAALSSLPLRRLQMYGVSLLDPWELERFPALETLETQNLDLNGVSALSHLSHLTSLTVTHPLGLPLQALEPLNMLERLYFYGAETSVPETGAVRLPSLRYLEMNNGQFPHFRWLEGMPALRELVILQAECDSLDGLALPPHLASIACGEPLAGRIRMEYPGKAWNIN